jgi:F-type H+-transporting ATPase subunit gamma
MPSLLDMRRRIKSVKNTQQITKAMKMVAAAKLKRAQDRVTASRPFAGKMSDVLGALSSKVAGEFSHPLLDERGDSKYLIVLISAEKASPVRSTQTLSKQRRLSSRKMTARSTR